MQTPSCHRPEHLFNRSLIRTVLVCPLTANLKRTGAPGNVLLDAKESNLTRQSVVNVSQLFTVDKAQLENYVGTLSSRRIAEILDGIKLVLEPLEPD